MNISIMEKVKGYRNQNDSINVFLELCVCFLMSFLPRFYISMKALPVRTISDEVASMAVAAYYAGYNWSDVVQNAGYYGTGFFGLFFWVFKLTDDPVLIYRVILCGCSMAQALVAVICAIMARQLFNIKNSLFICLISILCSFCVATRAVIAYNEHVLILLSWLYALFLLLQYKYKSGKKNFFYSVIAAFILGYGYTIHIRFSIVIIASVIAGIVFWLLFRERLFSFKTIICCILFLTIAGIYVYFIQRKLWTVENGENIRNTSISISTSVDWISASTIKAWIYTVVGQITTMNIAMLGLFVFAMVSAMFLFIHIVKCIYQGNCTNISERDKLMFLLFAIFILCSFGTIFAQSISSWIKGASEGLSQNVKGDFYSYKVFTYIRYAAPYVGPLIFGGFIYCYFYKAQLIKIIYWSWLIQLGLSIFFIQCIVPYIAENKNAVEVFEAWAFWWKYNDLVTTENYLISIKMILSCYFLYYILIKRKRIGVCLFLMIVLLQIQYVNLANKYDMGGEQANYKSVYKTYEVVQKLNIKQDIYVYDARQDMKDHQIFYLYQFYLNRYHIIPDLPRTYDGDEIVISNRNISEMLGDNLYLYKIAEKQYIYVGEKYRENLNEIIGSD